MIENEPEKPKKGWGWGCWGTFAAVLLLFIAILWPIYGLMTVTAKQIRTVSAARQIVGLLLTYAADHDGHYPDHGRDTAGLTSNEAFRELVKEGLVQDETIFGCELSRFKPDGNLGQAPGFDEALTAGENHWMMVSGLGDRSPGHYPLVLENAADASWPPRWLATASWFSRKISAILGEPPARGRAWADGTIIIAFNDAVVQTVKLDPKSDGLHLPASVLTPEGKAPLPVFKLLDIQVADGEGAVQ